ncbi:MAG: nuclear transport factor 2 family protein [Proteobacteria bacterium]|nr:nuclear transport factor 2 family protein [Pseudomonadota bacterium]
MSTALSRRSLIEAGGGALAAAAMILPAQGARAAVGAGSKNEAAVMAYYKVWVESRNWADLAAILTDDFTFSSTNGEDHISKAEFRTECWDNQVGLTKAFDVELMMEKGDQVFIKYLGHTMAGNTFRNVELHRVRDGKIASVECFFGAKASFPSAADAQKKG